MQKVIFSSIITTVLTVVSGMPCNLTAEEKIIQCQIKITGKCEVPIKEPGQKYRFEFVTATVSRDERVVKEVLVYQGQQLMQRLAIPDMTPFFEEETIDLYAQDLNQDGYEDVWFVTDKGAANTYAMYWLYSSVKQNFITLGKYPWLKLNVDNKMLSAYERHGHGGKIYTKKTYIIRNESLILKEVEKQTLDKSKNTYINTITKE